jgi:hypothetical protein
VAKDVKSGGAYVELGVKDKLDKALAGVKKKLENFGSMAQKVGAGLGASGVAIVGPLVAAAKVFGETGAALDDISKRTGVSGSKLSALSYAAEMSGTNVDTLEKGLGKMAKTLYSADEESKNAVDSLADLGLNVEELKGLKPDQQFEKIADALSKVQDPTARAALAMQVFGGAGTDLLPMFEDGAAGLADMAAEAQKLGLVLSDDAISSAAGLDDSFGQLWMTVKGLTMQVGAAIAGPLTSFLQTASQIIAVGIEWISQNQWLVQILAGVGAALAAAGTLIAGAGVAATALAAGIGAVGTVVAALTSPIALVAAGLAGLIAALATMTNVFDPVVNYLSEGFSWLSGIVSETMTGITAAFSTGDLGKAAAIAFTGVRLVVSQTMESVLGIFGSSIGEMSRFLAELYKQIGTVVGRLNEARANFSQWLAQGIGAVAGIEVLDEDNADLMSARAWSQSWKELDTAPLAEAINDAFDPEKLKGELDSLVSDASAAARDAEAQAEAKKREGFGGIDPTSIAKGPDLSKALPKSLGGFSAAALNRAIAGPKDFTKDTAKNTLETAKGIRELIAIVPTIAPRFS